MTMVVSEATGWCGLVAVLFEHQLRNRYYVALSALLVLAGLLHDWYVAKGLNNPPFLVVLKIRALFREFPRATGHKGQPRLPTSLDPGADSAPDEG